MTMPNARISGSWSRRTIDVINTPLTSDRDPEHLNPTPTPEFAHESPAWQDSTGAPGLPVSVLDEQLVCMYGAGGPVDNTPIDHAYGMGTGPGLSTLEAQDYRMAWHMTDDGAVAAHQWVPMMERDDRPGSPGAAFIPHVPGDGDSPQTLQLERTGVGQPNDPEARPGKRFARWRDRYIDMHRWTVETRPLTPKYARGAQEQPAVPAGTQINSPYATSVTQHLGPKDTFVPQFVRRAPGAWDESLATDGAGSSIAGAVDNYGLGRWGL
jgi:hypothetical protein